VLTCFYIYNAFNKIMLYLAFVLVMFKSAFK